MERSNPARASEHQTGCSWLSERCEFNTTSKITPADQGKSQDVLTYHGPAVQQLLAP